MVKKKIVFLTGAGMSVESGLRTFRGYDGLWEEYPVSEVATHTGWKSNPTKVNEFYNMLRAKYRDVKPCEGHKIIADLEQREDYEVKVITQNVDSLHEMAGSTEVLHLHGELMKACSDGTYGPGEYITDLDPEDPKIEPGTLAPDGTLLRPYIVFFEEPVPKMSEAVEITKKSDIFVVIGTSLSVYPAAGLLQLVPSESMIYVIDPGTPDLYNICCGPVTHIKKGASEGMKELVNILIEGCCYPEDERSLTGR